MSDLSFELESESAELSEQYYQYFDRWSFDQSSERERSMCIELAESYQRSLVDHIAYLNSLSGSAERDRALGRYRVYLDLLLRDMDILVRVPLQTAVR
jgi:hypothetical protein